VAEVINACSGCFNANSDPNTRIIELSDYRDITLGSTVESKM